MNSRFSANVDNLDDLDDTASRDMLIDVLSDVYLPRRSKRTNGGVFRQDFENI